ncbi:fibronectin type III domain-containing protein [Glycocaulis abyssi]|uniref:Fibronectin type III domain-containing protein n=1 Tax=Glycocaulis abyssi TaxID=1433403 RepID=A0ABV9NDA1_9PROT
MIRFLSIFAAFLLLVSVAHADPGARFAQDHTRAPEANPHAALEAQVSDILDRFAATLEPEALVALTPEAVASALTEEERNYLSTAFVHFSIDRPARIYLAYDGMYGERPFWLEELGFERRDDIDFIVDLEDPYELWQREYEAGEVRLGIPSFSGELKPYIVFAAPLGGGETIEITPLVDGTDVQIAAEGGEPFLDDNDYFNALPAELDGLPVLRSYESWEFVSRMVGFFRTTDYPSSATPDHIIQTWQGDPREEITIQWRTSAGAASDPVLWYAPENEMESVSYARAETVTLRSRQIVNDPAVDFHRVRLTGLEPGGRYAFGVSANGGENWSEVRHFHTAAEPGAQSWQFAYLGDPQNGLDEWGDLIRQGYERFPEIRFWMIAGDLIDKGTERDNWDQFFEEGSAVFDRSAVVPAIGNHDSHGGHPTLYLQQFALPDNGSEHLDPGRTYHLTYQDMLIVVMDSNYDLIEPETQTEWLDRVLGTSDARWKVVIYHHPFYASRPGRDNQPLRDAWGPIFDRHNVDIAFQGHDHAYMRTVPMRDHRPAEPGEHGTIYLVAVSGTKMYEQELRDFVAFGTTNERTYQIIDMDSAAGTLSYRAINADGVEIDAFALEKE